MGSFIGVQKIAAAKIGISYKKYLNKIKKHKWCSGCKSWQLRKCFNIDNHRGDGLASKCHNCTRVKEKQTTKGRPSWFKGKKHSAATRKLISQRVRAKKLKPPMLGRKHTVETRIKISRILRERSAKGKRCHSYKDGKHSERMGLRYSVQYKRWRFDVYSRDKFTCQKCGDKKGGNLNAHHIKPFADYPELRFEVSNGITLCKTCHKKEHSKKL